MHMHWRKKASGLFILFFMALFCMYGCAYRGSTFLGDKPPERQIYQDDIKTTDGYGKRETQRAFSTTAIKHGVIFIEKSVPEEVQVDKPFDYTIKVINLTGAKVKDVVVTEIFSHKYKLNTSFPKLQKGPEENTAQWFVGDLEQNETKEIRIYGVPLETGTMPFCTDVTYNLPPLCVVTNIVEPKLSITKRAPAEVLLCDTIPITFVVSNTGTGIAYNILLRDSLPQGLKTLDGRSDIVQEIGSLNPGESREIALTVQADKTGKFNNTATVDAEGGLHAESNTTTTAVNQPLLKIVKKGPAKIYTGRNITYTIAVSNKGNCPAVSTVLEDIIPENASFASASQGNIFSGNTVSWNLGTIQPRDSRKVSVTLRDKGLGEVKNTAIVRADCVTPVTVSVMTKVLGIPAILLEVIDVEDPIEVGSNETYVITVTNQGSDTGTNIKVTCMLEDTMQYVSSSGPTQGTASADGMTITFDPLPTLASKAKATWNVVVKALSTGDVRFKVNMIEDCLKRPVEETEATNFYK